MTGLDDVDAPAARRQHSTLSSVRNAARLLKEFSRDDRELGVTEISRRLGIGKSTAHRLLSTLAEERLLEQDPSTGAYRLGLAMFELGSTVSPYADLHDACSPVLDQLRAATGASVEVAVLDGRDVLRLERREDPQTPAAVGNAPRRSAAHCTSTGKVLLANLAPPRLDALLTGWDPERRTPATIHDLSVLREELLLARRQGWATDLGESEPGLTSVAAPIRNASGEVVAAVAVRGPSSRLTRDSLTRFTRPTLEAGLAISRRLGFRDSTTPRSGA